MYKVKRFSSVKEAASKTIKYVKDNPVVALSGTSIALSGANLAVNARRSKKADKYKEEQLNAMRDLTTAMTTVNKTIKTSPIIKESNKSSKRLVSLVRIKKKENDKI